MSRRRKAKAIAALVCSVFIVVMCAVAFGMMINNTGEKMLQVYGLENLKFFTVLSNLLLGMVSAVYAACTARALATWLIALVLRALNSRVASRA